MNRVDNLIIVQKSAALPDNLRTVFRNAGYLTHTAFNAQAVFEKIDKIKLAYIIVDCGDELGMAERALKELLQVREVPLFPIVFMRAEDDKPPKEIFEKFLSLNTLTYPCDSEQVLGLLKQLDKDLDTYIERLKKVAPELVPDKIPELVEEIEPVAAQVEFPTGFAGAVFSKFDEFRLHEKPLGGALFCQEVTHDLLDVRHLVPRNAEYRKSLETIMKNLPPEAHKNVYSRVLIGGQTTSVLPVSEELQEAGLLALYALPAGFTSNVQLFSINYLNPLLAPAREDVARLLLQSADFASGELSKQTAPLIKEMSELITGTTAARDDDQSLIASMLVAADLADRACRENGSWHPRLTYVFLSKLYRGEFSQLHPASLAILLKFLGETISNSEPDHLIPKKIRYNKTLLEKHKLTKKQEVDRDERKIPIARLTPGMRLSRPIVGYDGRLVLQENVVLDQDMILRIWRLASVKIMNTPIVVFA